MVKQKVNMSKLGLAICNSPLTRKEIFERSGVDKTIISRIVNAKRNSIRLITFESLCSVLDLSPDDYLLSPSEYEKQLIITDFDFKGVYSYQFNNGITYIGKPSGDMLVEACMIPTNSIADLCYSEKRSSIKVQRTTYYKFKVANQLDAYEKFNPLEAIVKCYLGKEKSSIIQS